MEGEALAPFTHTRMRMRENCAAPPSPLSSKVPRDPNMREGEGAKRRGEETKRAREGRMEVDGIHAVGRRIHKCLMHDNTNARPERKRERERRWAQITREEEKTHVPSLPPHTQKKKMQSLVVCVAFPPHL